MRTEHSDEGRYVSRQFVEKITELGYFDEVVGWQSGLLEKFYSPHHVSSKVSVGRRVASGAKHRL